MPQCQADQHPSPRSSEGILAPLKPIALAMGVRTASMRASGVRGGERVPQEERSEHPHCAAVRRLSSVALQGSQEPELSKATAAGSTALPRALLSLLGWTSQKSS